MSMFSIFNVSGSAVSAQSQRLNTVASNLANVDAVAGPDGKAYKARQVVFQTEKMGAEHTAGVRVSAIKESDAPGGAFCVGDGLPITPCLSDSGQTAGGVTVPMPIHVSERRGPWAQRVAMPPCYGAVPQPAARVRPQCLFTHLHPNP